MTGTRLSMWQVLFLAPVTMASPARVLSESQNPSPLQASEYRNLEQSA